MSKETMGVGELYGTEDALEVEVAWGDSVLHLEHLSPPAPVVLDQAALGGPGGTLELVRLEAGQPVVQVPAGGEGTLRRGGEATPLGPGAHAPLAPGAEVELRRGDLRFRLSLTDAAPVPPVAPPFRWQRHVWVGVSLAVHLVLLVAFALLPEHGAALSAHSLSAEERFLTVSTAAPETPPEEPEESQVGAAGAEEGTEGRAHAGDEGLAGDPDEAPTGRRFALRHRHDGAHSLSREELRARARNSSAIGAVRSLLGSDALTSPFGSVANGDDPFDAAGNLFGTEFGPSFGAGGLRLRSTGDGAGGDGEDTIGVGEHGTIGMCRGPRCGEGDGTGRFPPGDLTGTPRPRPPVVPERATVLGQGLAPDVVRRVVRRHLNEVRYCYEQQLQGRPDLAGRVSVQWVINQAGSVQSARVAGNTLGSPQVASCVQHAVRRWQFPSSDGTTGVTFPFRFRAPGGR